MEIDGMTAAQREQWDILGNAMAILEKQGVPDDEVEKEARLNGIMIGLANEKKISLSRVLSLLVVDAVRKRHWLLHPPSDDFPEGYKHIRDYLYDCGITDKYRFELASFGDMIELMDAQGYDTDVYLTTANLPKLNQVRYKMIGALQAEIKALPPPERTADELLGMVKAQRSRESLREALRGMDGIVAKGAVNRVDDHALVVLSVYSASDIPSLVNKLKAIVDWSLVTDTNVRENSLSILVNEPFRID